MTLEPRPSLPFSPDQHSLPLVHKGPGRAREPAEDLEGYLQNFGPEEAQPCHLQLLLSLRPQLLDG